MTTTEHATSTRKVRRDTTGGKRGDGHALQDAGRRRRRPDPCAIRVRADDPSVTSVAGLVGFGTFLRRLGVDAALRAHFDGLKSHPRVVYPMHAQLRLLIDAVAAGETRVFGLESLAADPLFVTLAGGAVPSIDVLYDDLARFDSEALARLDAMLAEHGLAPVRAVRRTRVHLDIDTTVEALFGGSIEGALPGPNPRYHGRPSYHPMLARVAETGTIVGAKLRPGDTSFGNDDVPTVIAWVRRVRAAVGPACAICVRIDAAGDCTELLDALEREHNVTFIVKARLTADLCSAIALHSKWTTVEPVVGERPTLQTAEIRFYRPCWKARYRFFRIVAVRSRERDCGKQVYLWDGLDWTVQAFVTNDEIMPVADVAPTYNLRAGIEPLIADLKNGVGIGKIPTQSFDANHAMFLLKVLAFNLLRRYVVAHFAPIAWWRTPWARRAIILQPGRLVRSGRGRALRVHPASMLARDLN
jgi:hypothetical protein